MKKLKTLSQFKAENENAIMEASSCDMVRTFGCGFGCDDSTESSESSTENNDTCTITTSDKGKLISHEHEN